MEFLVLGPLQVLDSGRPVTVSAPRQRALLAVLLANANQAVSTDRLLDLAWGDDQPDVGALRYQMSKLRDTLEPQRESGDGSVIVTQSPGYVLHATPGQLDVLGFETLLGEAESVLATDPGRSLQMLDEALSLWRGDAYADFAYEEFARLEIVRLEERRLEAVEARFDALLALGRDREVVGELQAAVAEHPHRERLTAALMLALYRSGRQADALASFQSLRRGLGEELGIEPSKDLVDLEERILLQDESLTVQAAVPAAEYLRGYVLRGRIGEGAHGVVWRAAQPGVGREVAIKAIHPDIANRAGFVRRFEMEAQLVASLEHPHIVSLFDFWRDPEGAYLVMPHLRGGNLAHLLLQGPLRKDAALELIESIGDALSYAHRRGVVHRDVTPQNVLLDDEGHPYLADFGVAALIGETGSATSSSPAYLAPEQQEGRGAVPESDVYSLGVLAHSVLTGEVPDVDQRLHPVSQLNPDVATAVDDVIARATATDIAERFIEPSAFVAALAAALNGGGQAVRAIAPQGVRNPYKGLRAFGESDSPDFFGRDVAISELVDAIARHRLVAVIGPSGCGKSSLVRAGLVADLRQGALPGSERWLITDMYPGVHPLNELGEALLRVAVERPVDLVERLAEGDLGDILGGLLPRDTELLLVVDQFEELFTLTVDETERRRFLDILTSLATDPASRARVLVTMRADFFDRPLGYAEFGDLLRRGMVPITVPSVESLEQAVVGPAESVGLQVEAGLERVITRDVADQPGGLPLLEFALTELFNDRVGDELTAAGYQRTGGVLGALGRRAEDLFVGCDDAGREAIEQVFLRLVTVEEGVEDTRRRIPLAELHEIGIEQGTLDRVLGDYGSHRLLTFDRDPETRAPTVEVAHEALLTKWDRLRTWIDQRRDDLVLHRRLAAAVREWQDSERRAAYLFSGGRLEHYEHFAEETDLALTGPELGFLEAGRLAEDEMLARRRRRRLGVMAILGSAAVIAAVLAVVAFVAQQRAEDASAEAQANEELAEQQTRIAEQQAAIADQQALTNRARALASEAELALGNDQELSLLLAVEAVSVELDGGPLKEAIDALHLAVSTSRARLNVPGNMSIGLDATGATLLIKGNDDTLALIDTTTGETLSQVSVPTADWTLDQPHSVVSVALSGDGSQIASGWTDGTVSLWDAATGRELLTTNDRQAISTDGPSGTFILTYGSAATAPIPVDASAADLELALEGLPEVADVSVSGSGTPDDPWQVDVVDTSLPYIGRFVADGSGIEGSAEGTVAVTLVPEQSVALIEADATSGSFVLTLAESSSEPIGIDADSEAVEAAAESLPGMPDVTLLHDEAGFWVIGPAEEGVELPLLGAASIDLARLPVVRVTGRGHSNPDMPEPGFEAAAHLEFSPDGSLLASRGWDETIRLWNTSTFEELRVWDAPIRRAVFTGFAFNRDGTLLAAASNDAVRVWNVADGSLLHLLAGEEGINARDVAFFPDGNRIAVAHPRVDDPLTIWDLESETESVVGSEGGWFLRLDVSADGTLIAAGDDGGDVVVHEVTETGGQSLYDLKTNKRQVYDLAFAASGHILATVDQFDAKVWDLGPGGTSEWLTLPVSDLGLLAVAYSPDGTLLVRAPVDENDIVVANAESGDEIVRLGVESDAVADLAFSPDGVFLAAATGSELGMVLVWDTRSWELIAPLAVPDDPESSRVAWSVEFSPDGAHLAAIVGYSGDAAGLVRVWDTSSYSEVFSLDLKEEDGTVFKVLAFDPQGDRLAARGSFRDPESGESLDLVHIYDLAGNLQQVCCEHWWEPIASSISYSPDGTLLLTAGMDQETQEGTVILWDADSGDEVRTLLGHVGPAYAAAFSSDGSLVASGAGGDVRVWETATGTEVAQMINGPSIVHEVAFDPDGSRLASASDIFGLVRVWALDLDDLIQIAEDRLTRTFTQAECEIYDIDPCPTLE